MRESNIAHLRPTDVLLASYPRSGNTWMLNLLCVLGVLVVEGYNDDLETANGPHDLPERPYYRRPGLRYLRSISPVGTVSPFRVVKTHSLPDTLPPTRAIYIYRDGRDAVLSYYHYSVRFDGFPGDLTAFLQSENHPARRWSEHVESWLRVCARGEAMPLRYETLLSDTIPTVRSAVRYLGLERTDAEVRAAVDFCHFSKMRASEEAEFPDGRPASIVPFFRKGVQGDWREGFTDEQLAMVMDAAQHTLLQLAYT